MKRLLLLQSLFIALSTGSAAQEKEDGREGPPLLLENFRPESSLQLKHSEVLKAKAPVIDVHTHFRLKLRSREQLDDFVKVMDRNNIALCVSLDGQLGGRLAEHLAFLNAYPDRFAVLANIDWQGPAKADDFAHWDCHRDDFPRRMAEALRDAKTRGAVGLKIFKNFGLEIKNPDGSLVHVDDARWDPIWTACGELGFPVLIHTADPVAFFRPIDEKNERWEELHRHPDWSFFGGGYPSHGELMQQFINVVKRHPRTNFIAAHMANDAENLAQLEEWLAACPNLHLDIASRINELGRQPYSARDFLVKHETRVLFGTDGPWPESRLRLYWRFLETRDEYFPYSEKEFPPQGLWNIYGVYLPADTLANVYAKNALRLMPALQAKYDEYIDRAAGK